MSSTYPYRALDPARPQIRLLQLQSTNTVDIICTLTSAYLDDSPSFTALSYVWGDASITEPILLDGHQFQVTTNLAAALRHIQQHWEFHFSPRDPAMLYIWVDAICIDQDSIPERNSQVQLMDMIYSRAELVISWLGSGDDTLLPGFEALKIIVTEPVLNHDHPSDEPDVMWLEDYPALSCDEENYVEGLGHFRNHFWEAIRRIQTLEYWKRLWILQETVLGRTVLLAYGPVSMPFMDFVTACTWLASTKSFLEESVYSKPDFLADSVWMDLSNWGGSARFCLLQSMRDTFVPGYKDDFEYQGDILNYSRDLIATEPRDYVYGILGLLDSSTKPDYSKPISEIYLEHFNFFLGYHMDDFLVDSGIGTLDRNLELPSWLPDYSAKAGLEDCIFGFMSKDNFNKKLFEAALIEGQVMPRGSTLMAPALLGPKITQMHDASLWKENQPEYRLRFMLDFEQRYPKYITGIHPLEAQRRAILAEDACLNHSLTHYRQIYGFLTTWMGFFGQGITNSQGSNPQDIPLVENFGVITPDSTASNFGYPTLERPLDTRQSGEEAIEEVFFPAKLKDILAINQAEKAAERLRWRVRIRRVSKFHRFVETQEGYLGLAPKGTLPGDLICLIKDCKSVFVLRKVAEHYIMIGTCYMVGLMDGEFRDLWEQGKAKFETLEIW